MCFPKMLYWVVFVCLCLSWCDDVVVLDGLTVTVGNTAVAPSVVADDCPRVAIQDCTASGGQGLVVRNASTVYLSAGSVDLLDVPVLAVAVLYPFVVADGHPARVRENVGDDGNAPVEKNGFAVGVDGTVSAFGDQTDLKRVGFCFSDLVF